ncbi:hypothetical protein VYU27_009266 [Nannochloropsis oceanica]
MHAPAAAFTAFSTRGVSSFTVCILVLLTITLFILLLLRLCFGTISIPAIWARYEKKAKLEDAYARAYRRREDTLYHRDWAKSRGAFAEAKRMEQELEGVEAELDVLDDKLSQYSSIDGEKQEGEKQI